MIGIYKSGQGYWVRVLTAVGAGVLVLAAAAWAWQQAAAYSLPTPSWTFSLQAAQGELAAGQSVALLDTAPGSGAEALDLGVATVRSAEGTGEGRVSVVLEGFQLALPEYDPSMARYVQSDAGFGAQVRASSGVPIFEPLYLQAGAAGLILLLGAIGVYFFVAVRKPAVDFLVATDGEMKKVNWSTRREVVGSTIVVVVATFLLAAALFSVDFVFSQIFKAAGVLDI